MTRLFRAVMQHDAAGGLLLVIAAALAILMANSPLRAAYDAFLALPVGMAISDFAIQKPLLLWINDGLMAVFFFLIGLEVKREMLEGHLSSKDQIILPAIAAFAGMAMPALIYTLFNGSDPVTSQGWAVPAATDIAFALGIFSLFGRHLPLSLKLFLLSVAIFDDLAAIVIIALFYSTDLSIISLVIAATGLTALFALNRSNVSTPVPYMIIGFIVWAAVLKSGVHATLAGFAIALFIPLRSGFRNGEPMLKRMEHKLHPWVAFFILPVFAFSNAGVNLSGIGLEELMNPLTLGIMLGLFLGNQIGIFSVSWLAIRSGLAKMPAGADWQQLYGVSVLCGIGFTMSLFIGSLAFGNLEAAYLNSVKTGVLAGSLLSALFGSFILYRSVTERAVNHKSAVA